MKTRIFHLCLLTVLLCAAAFGQASDAAKVKELEAKAKAEPNNLELWLQLGQMQFVGSRGLDDSLLQAAQASFEHVLQVKADEPRALVWHGVPLVIKSGRLFQAGNLSEAQGLLTRGFDEMDRGIKASPADASLRRLRGETNLRVPEFLGRTALGVEDFELFTSDPSFDKNSPEAKSQTYLLLGTGYSRLGKSDLAQQMWQKAAAVAPESRRRPHSAGRRASKSSFR